MIPAKARLTDRLPLLLLWLMLVLLVQRLVAGPDRVPAAKPAPGEAHVRPSDGVAQSADGYCQQLLNADPVRGDVPLCKRARGTNGTIVIPLPEAPMQPVKSPPG